MLNSQELMDLAIKAAAQTHPQQVRPNPRVGCAIQSKDGVIAVAAHLKAGEGHAEVRALQKLAQLGASSVGATAAVTLEPCAHHGKTPPCAEALIANKIGHVSIGVTDPFEKVSGRGMEMLREAGIRVELGVKNEECRALNEAWLFAHAHKRPFVTLKIATSLDGAWKTKLGEDRWVTGPEARFHSHQLRAEVDALLTSFPTIRDDDPSLTARNADGDLLEYQPQPLIASRNPNAALNGKTSESFFAALKIAEHPKSPLVLDAHDWDKCMSELYSEGTLHVMVEAGRSLSQALLAQGKANEILHYTQLSYFGESSHRFSSPFAEGKLPGLKLACKEIVPLSSETILLKLAPKGF